MKSRNFKILVLSDLKDATYSTLKSTVGLAKMIGGDIEFFHVTKPTEVVNRESQLSAMRNINETLIVTDKKIKRLLEPILLDGNISIKHRYALGNVKREIEKRIEALQPDVVVLGKRKPKAIKLIGDKVTEFILENYKGAIMIASKDKVIDADNQLSIGTLNDFEQALDKKLTRSLINKAITPLKSFKIGDALKEQNVEAIDNNRKVVQYIFEDGPSALTTISDYVTKNNINLLCLERKSENSKQVIHAKHLIDKVGVSLLVT